MNFLCHWRFRFWVHEVNPELSRFGQPALIIFVSVVPSGVKDTRFILSQ